MILLTVVIVAVFGGILIHAHNDCEHARPCLDALSHRYDSIEADVFPIDGHLWIGHDRLDLVPERTLDSLYLRPLAANTKRHGGSVYGDGKPVFLVVDIKEDPRTTYEILKRELDPYREIISSFDGMGVTQRAITVLLSGERTTSFLSREIMRLAFVDGRIEDLPPTTTDPSLIPMISAAWDEYFSWRGQGEMGEKDHERLTRMIANAHGQSQLVRFWATPEIPHVWQTLSNMGVDCLGADDLAKLASFRDKQIRA